MPSIMLLWFAMKIYLKGFTSQYSYQSHKLLYNVGYLTNVHQTLTKLSFHLNASDRLYLYWVTLGPKTMQPKQFTIIPSCECIIHVQILILLSPLGVCVCVCVCVCLDVLCGSPFAEDYNNALICNVFST